MHLDIITSEKTIVSRDVDMVVLPAFEGEMGVLPGHMPMIILLKNGDIRITSGDKTDVFSVDNGYARITCDKVVILPEKISKKEN